MRLKSVHVNNTVQYCIVDRYSGRCRLNQSTMSIHQIKVGSVVQLKCYQSHKIIFVLCTAWPDMFQCIDEDMICIDDAVQLLNENDNFCSEPWEQTFQTEILSIQPFLQCQSIRGTILDKKPFYSVMPFVGLPVADGCSICAVRCKSFLKRPSIRVRQQSNARYSVIGTSTIILKGEIIETIGSKLNGNSFAIAPQSNMLLIEEMIRRTVWPCIARVPSKSNLKGMLLYGPPGVGKSYSLKAVQMLSAPLCQIHIHDINIPDLLADSNPIQALLVSLQTISNYSFPNQSNSRVNRSNTSNNQPMQSPSSHQSSNHNNPSGSNAKKGYVFSSPKTPQSTTGTSTPDSTLRSPELKDRSPVDRSISSLAGLIYVGLDEIDALGNDKKENEIQIALKDVLYHWMDNGFDRMKGGLSHPIPIVVIATTNRSGDVDKNFRRGGRLEHEIAVINTFEDRRRLVEQMIVNHFYGYPDVDSAFVASEIAERTGGYVAADLNRLFQEVLRCEEVCSASSDKDQSSQNMVDLITAAMQKVPPSCLRGVKSQFANVRFDDIVGYESVKQELRRVMALSVPHSNDETSRRIRRFGLKPLGGVLLHGPPGNAKTRLVMAVATQYALPLISLSVADVYSPFVGDAEAEIRKAFQVARQATPCILFIDELDSMVTNRNGQSGNGTESASAESRILATLLAEMDGICSNETDYDLLDVNSNRGSSSQGIIVMGATNRLDFIDPALLRKGRFHQVLNVPTPNASDRVLIMRYFVNKLINPVADALESQLLVDTTSFNTLLDSKYCENSVIEKLEKCLADGMSGADIENLCREEAMHLIRQFKPPIEHSKNDL